MDEAAQDAPMNSWRTRFRAASDSEKREMVLARLAELDAEADVHPDPNPIPGWF